MMYNRAIKIMLNFDHVRKLDRLKLIYKCLHNQAPNLRIDLVVLLRVSGSITPGVSTGICNVPFRKPSSGQTAVPLWGSNMWSSFPTELKTDHD